MLVKKAVSGLEGQGYFFDEVQIGLVHEVDAYCICREVVAFEQVEDGAGDLARGLQDDFETLHLDEAGVGKLERVGVVAVGGEDGVGDAGESGVGGDDAGSGSVAEEDGGGVGISIGDAARHDLGGDDKHVAVARGKIVC